MKFLYILILSCFPWLLQQVYAESTDVCSPVIKQIHVSKSTDPEILPIDYDVQWSNVEKLPDWWNRRWGNYAEGAWYQIIWTQHCMQSNQPVMILVESMTMAGKIYVNQKLIWQDQSLVEPLSRSWRTPRIWGVPAADLKKGENTLWIYVQGVSTQTSGLGRVWIGADTEILPLYQQQYVEARALHFIVLVMGVTTGIICFFIWLFQRKSENILGWYALVCSLWAGYLITILADHTFFGMDTITFECLSTLLFCGYVLVGWIFALRFAGRHLPRFEKCLWCLGAVTFAIIVLIPHADIVLWLKLCFGIWVLIFMIKCLVYPWFAYQSKQLEVYLFAGLLFILFPVGLNDSYAMMMGEARPVFSAYIAPITTIFIALTLAMRMSKRVKVIKAFNETLTQTVAQVKQELSQSLNTTHLLELENVKLQERVNLAHDLHDGLGGALIRSMTLIEQSSSQISNHQALAILKLLRDDLRQIVDQRSSIETEVPETPIQWLAPVRYRFNRIFDELDVAISWKIPSQWLFPMVALDCLTLQRILEEALTNVLKHSHATEIRVCLSLDQHHLSLSIEDNGVGFNVNVVMDAGLSVGLRSMQARARQMDAEMTVQSEAGCSLIVVTKLYS